MQQLVAPLSESVELRLAAQDQDQEVKEAAISCAATVIAGLGDVTNGAYLGQVKVGNAPDEWRLSFGPCRCYASAMPCI